MADDRPILVTGGAGQLGAVGRTATELLLDRGLPVRAMVRREDDRAAALRAAGAEVVVGDLLEPADVHRVVSGCRRVYFGMSVSAGYLEATVTMAAVAREVGVDALVNMSQMTVSQMSIQNTTPRRQQRQHWLSEQALAWSGLPVVTIRPTMFLGLPEHLTLHLLTMAELHRAGRYDRLADGVERVTGRPAMSVREFVSLHAGQFG
jgi:NAD(P)H dehydrogenase (quinone)